MVFLQPWLALGQGCENMLVAVKRAKGKGAVLIWVQLLSDSCETCYISKMMSIEVSKSTQVNDQTLNHKSNIRSIF